MILIRLILSNHLKKLPAVTVANRKTFVANFYMIAFNTVVFYKVNKMFKTKCLKQFVLYILFMMCFLQNGWKDFNSPYPLQSPQKIPYGNYLQWAGFLYQFSHDFVRCC